MVRRTTNTPENFPERFRAKLEKALATAPHLVDSNGNQGGLYSGLDQLLTSQKIPNAQPIILLSSFGEGEAIHIPVPLGTSTPTEQQRRFIAESAKAILREHGFTPSLRPSIARTPEETRRGIEERVKAEVARSIAGDPDFAGAAPHAKGIFKLSTTIPRSEEESPALKLELRPYSHIERTEHEYVPVADQLTVATGTLSLSEAKRHEQHIRQMLTQEGFHERELARTIRVEKSVPKQWIDLDRLAGEDGIIKPVASPYYCIFLVRAGGDEQRPPINCGTKLREKAQAMEARDALLRDYIAPRLAEGNQEPITLQEIQDWLSVWRIEKGYDRVEADFQRRPNATRNVSGKFRGFSPILRGLEAGHPSVAVHIAPFADGRPPLAVQSTGSSFLLNTNDPEMMEFRASIINDIAIAAVRTHLENHPDAAFATEQRPQRYKGKMQLFSMLKLRPDVAYAITPTAQEVTQALKGEGDDQISPFSRALVDAIRESGVSTAGSESELAGSLSRALQGKTTNDLDAALSLGAEAFLRQNPHYHVGRDTQGTPMSVDVNRAIHIDAAYLQDEIIRPAVKKLMDSPRMIAWQIKVEPYDDADKRGMQCITLTALRNPFTAKAEPAEGPWSKPFTLDAKTTEDAQAFTAAVTDHLYQDQLTSIERPVEDFGTPSQGVVLRESLKAGFRAAPDISIPSECPVKHILGTLGDDQAKVNERATKYRPAPGREAGWAVYVQDSPSLSKLGTNDVT